MLWLERSLACRLMSFDALTTNGCHGNCSHTRLAMAAAATAASNNKELMTPERQSEKFVIDSIRSLVSNEITVISGAFVVDSTALFIR